MTATIPVWIRFGDIPEDGQSKVHFGDQLVRNEGGVSVWDCVEVDGIYYPILPNSPNGDAVVDYFNHLFSDKTMFLVTGLLSKLNGADGEPLLLDTVIIKELGILKNFINS